MTNKRSVCFIIAFHNFATLEKWLTYQRPSSWPVVITMKKKLAGSWKKKYKILAGPNERQQVSNRWNPEKTGISCGGADFSWLSSKVSRTLPQGQVTHSGGIDLISEVIDASYNHLPHNHEADDRREWRKTAFYLGIRAFIEIHCYFQSIPSN